MREALFMLVTCFSGALVFIVVFFLAVAVICVGGGREFSESYWQTFVCMIGAAGVTGFLMSRVARFWHKKILK